VDSTFILFPLDLTLALDDDGIVLNGNRDVFILEARQFSRNDQVAITVIYLNGWHPNRVVISSLGRDSSLTEYSTHLLLHSPEQSEWAVIEKAKRV
jgi:hypothetical protein